MLSGVGWPRRSAGRERVRPKVSSRACGIKRRLQRRKWQLLPSLVAVLAFAVLPTRSTALEKTPPPAPLWPSPFEEQLSFESGVRDPAGQISSGGAIPGVAFAPGAGVLTRIEFELHDRGSEKPATFRLWEWQDDRKVTIQGRPLFEDEIPMGVGGSWRLHSVFPRVLAREGQHLYFELVADERGEFRARTARSRSARIDRSGSPRNRGGGTDEVLWFRSYRQSAAGNPKGASAQRAPIPFEWRNPIDLKVRRAPGREEYLARVQRYADAVTPEVLRGCGRGAHIQSFLEAFLYHFSCSTSQCDETRAARAIALLRLSDQWSRCAFDDGRTSLACVGTCGVGTRPADFRWIEDPVSAYELIRGSPSISVDDHATVRSLLVRHAQDYWPWRWRGSFNRSTLAAAGYARMAALFPEVPDAAAWRAYAVAVLSDFWKSMDTEEDSASYGVNAWLPGVLQLSKALDRSESLWREERFRTLIRRFADQVIPLGFMPGFGDGSGFGVDSPSLVWILEEAASRLREPRYRWLASRVYEYNQRHAIEGGRSADSWARDLRGLARAWEAADEDIPADRPSTLPSVVTYRHRAVPRAVGSLGRPPMHADITEELVPERLVLRSGADPGDMVAVFNLLSGYRHGHDSLGGLSALVHRGSVLMTETAFPYFRHEASQQDENVSMIQRYWGGKAKEPGRSVKLDRFDEGGSVTVAWLSWRDSSGWGVDQSRRIYFLKNRAIWVRDQFSIPAGLTAAVGSIWHAGAVAEKRGVRWFNLSQPFLLNNVWRYRNREHYAHLFLAPPQGGSVSVTHRQGYDPGDSCDSKALVSAPIPARCRFSPANVVHQHVVASGGASQLVEFDTVIVPRSFPSDPGSDDDDLWIRVSRPLDGLAILELDMEEESWLLLENATGTPVDLPIASTDGDYVVAATGKGQDPYFATSGAGFVQLRGDRRSVSTRGFCETSPRDSCGLP
jgi:hypothetical protein